MQVLSSNTSEAVPSNAPDGRVGRWSDRWMMPPLDIAIPTSPPGGRARAAREIAEHVRGELDRGRPLYCIVHDEYVCDRIGGFDGRARLPHRPGGLDR
jgi:hypothetical protein